MYLQVWVAFFFSFFLSRNNICFQKKYASKSRCVCLALCDAFFHQEYGVLCVKYCVVPTWISLHVNGRTCEGETIIKLRLDKRLKWTSVLWEWMFFDSGNMISDHTFYTRGKEYGRFFFSFVCCNKFVFPLHYINCALNV